MIWHMAVHPDFRRKGIARLLLERAIEESRRLGLSRLEAWTRSDDPAEKWYQSQGFQEIESYYHIYIDGSEMKSGIINSKIPDLKPSYVFAHYLGDDKSFPNQFNRAYRCIRYDLVME
jgi:ribosomal protein S18 acetylase RimI-like enzyme